MFTAVKKARALPIVAAIGLVALLAACSSTGVAPAGQGATSAVKVDVGDGTITPKNANNIAVMIQAGPTYSDSATKAKGAQAAAKALGVHVDIYWSALDAGTEISNYNTIMSSGKYGALAVQPVSPQLCKTIAADSVKAQMLVTVFASPLCATGTETGDALKAPGTISYIDQNNLAEGAKIMYDGAEKLLGDGPEKVLLVFGNQGHPTVVAHEKEWDKFAAAHPNWKLGGKIYTDWTTPGSYASTQNLLQANPDATVIFSTYIDITAGVVKAVAEQKLTKQISVFETSGGTDLSMQLLKAGTLAGSVPSRPYDVGYEAVKSIVDATKGKTQPAVIFLSADKTAMITQASDK
jgi:ABC-type sugar transport system substrate-binding protein